MKMAENITGLIGNTPIVKSNNIVPDKKADVFVKLESMNPIKSVKDRAAAIEIIKQMNGNLDAFVWSAATGGILTSMNLIDAE